MTKRRKFEKAEEMVGKTYGDWIVKGIELINYPTGSKKVARIKCVDCGFEKRGQINHLRNNGVQCVCRLNKHDDDLENDQFEQMMLKRLEEEEKARELKRRMNLANLPSAKTRAKSQKMVISL